MKKKLGLKIISLFLIVVFVFSLSINISSAATLSSPIILSFRVSDTNISLGETVNLSWFVYNAEKIEILGLEKIPEDLNLSLDSIEVWPMATTTYVLLATSADGVTTSRSVTVNVDGSDSSTPRINYFWTFDRTIDSGESINLWWNTYNATKVEIIGLEKDPETVLPLTGKLEVWPMATTTYILKAYGEDGTVVSKALTVNVESILPDPDIVKFEASSSDINIGETVTLSWDVINAVNIKIEGLEKEMEEVLPMTGELEVWTMATTTYTLTAYNGERKSIEKSITVNVEENEETPVPTVTPTVPPTKSIPTLAKMSN
jgi:hypothetical protein